MRDASLFVSILIQLILIIRRVADFVNEHPGGPGLILKCAGKDATSLYDEVHDPNLILSTLRPDQCIGDIDPDSVSSEIQTLGNKATPEYPALHSIISVADFERVAESYVSTAGWAYYASGADDEISISDARRTFRKITLRPRVLRPVEPISTTTTILGNPSSLPIYISPTGIGRYAHKDAETLISSVCGEEGLLYCMPTGSPHEAIFGAKSHPDQKLFFQLYANRDPENTKALVRKIEALGAAAIFLTVDTPVLGKRERDDRVQAADGADTVSPGAGGLAKTSSQGLLNPLLSWDDLAWLRKTTKLPMVLKGVQTVEDAVLAHAHGVDGIVLSNHGGRSLDTAQAPITTLLEIRRHAPQLLTAPIRNKFQVLLDGGVRRGTDVIKAVALGATAVGIGRPVLYSMCAGYGAEGLRRLIQILRTELSMNMALAGAKDIDHLVPELVNTERAENEVSRRVKL